MDIETGPTGATGATPAMHRRGTAQLVTGLIVIGVGVIFMLNNFGLIQDWRIGRLWPVILIVWGAMRVKERGFDGGFWGIVIAALGVGFLLGNYGLIRFHPLKLWPLLLVLVGIRVVRQALMGPNADMPGGIGQSHAFGRSSSNLTDSYLNETAIFGGGDRRFTGADFKGGHVTAVFGGFDIDLSSASMEGESATIDAFVMWGGLDIRVPRNWNVTLRTLSIFGGSGDKTAHPEPGADPAVKQLVITGHAIFGGIEIKN